MRILKALAENGGALALKDVAAVTAMPRGKVHQYLSSLRGVGMVGQNDETGRYHIGPAAVTVGLVGLARLSPIRQVHEKLRALRDRVNETVTAAIWGEMGPTIIAIEESDQLVTMNVRIGTVLPVLSTAIGRVFLAYLAPAQTRRLVAAERSDGGAGGVTDEAMRDVLAEIRARRLSRARSALLAGIDAVAAPVFDYRGHIIAVICAVGRSETMPTRWNGPVVQALTEAADDLSRQLGFVDMDAPPPLPVHMNAVPRKGNRRRAGKRT